MSEEEIKKICNDIYEGGEWQPMIDYITNLQQENKQLKELYEKTCKHLFNIGNEELARYFQAQILECPVFTPQVGDKENE